MKKHMLSSIIILLGMIGISYSSYQIGYKNGHNNALKACIGVVSAMELMLEEETGTKRELLKELYNWGEKLDEQD